MTSRSLQFCVRLAVAVALAIFGLAAAEPALASGSNCATAPPGQAVAGTTVQGACVTADPHTLVFQLATRKLPKSQTQLVGGVAVTSQMRDWSTIVLTPLVGVRPNGDRVVEYCTGTLVGPGVVLLAAHCLDQGTATLREAYLQLNVSTFFKFVCAADPAYMAAPVLPPPTPNDDPPPRDSHDVGLCYLTTPAAVPDLQAMKFDRVSVAPLMANAPVLMVGFGCTDLDAATRDGILRIGDTKLFQAPASTASAGDYATITSNGVQPALCPGDSGGPLMTGATAASQSAARLVRGVNSSITRGSPLVSHVAMLSYPSFSPWALGVVAGQPGGYVCGLEPLPGNARCLPSPLSH